MAYRKIGVVGATGLVGQEVTRALVEEGFEVVPFSRQTTTVAGIPTHQLGSFFGFDAVVSIVGHRGMDDQNPLIEQAKRDGVKRFIPSEWGVDHRIVKSDFFKPKVRAFKAVQEANFSDGWMAISCGFLDSVIPLLAKFDTGSSAIHVCGTGKKQYPFTVRYDLGRLLAYSFKHPTEYKDKWLTVVNDWLSLDEMAQAIQKKSKSNFPVEHLEVDFSTPVLRLVEVEGLSSLSEYMPVYSKSKAS